MDDLTFTGAGRAAAAMERLRAKAAAVEHLQLRFTDLLGNLKSVDLPAGRLEAVAEGVLFDGAALSGCEEAEELDLVARPDWSTLTVLPWDLDGDRTAFVFCDVFTANGEPFAGDSRHVLRRQVERAAELGLTYCVGPELEYTYVTGLSGRGAPAGVAPARSAGAATARGYFSAAPGDAGNAARRQTVRTLEELGIPIEGAHHEVGPGQHELNPRFDAALLMADRVMVIREVVREVAARCGLHATFMPKPLRREHGSGMHVHQSLFRGEVNAFYSDVDYDQLSETARGFIAGQLHYMREITALLNQSVNSYKRLVPGYEAPTFVSWAHRNRSTLIRVPLHVAGKERTVRAELRNVDPACNPYLAFAVMLAAGLAGIEKGHELPFATEPNIFGMSEDERRERELERLPDNLYEALTATGRSELVREVLGEQVFAQWLGSKLAEWEDYREQVDPSALPRGLRML